MTKRAHNYFPLARCHITEHCAIVVAKCSLECSSRIVAFLLHPAVSSLTFGPPLTNNVLLEKLCVLVSADLPSIFTYA